MKKLLPLALLLCCFSSCVTVFNRDFVTFRVNVDKRADVSYHKAYPEKGITYDVHSLPVDSGEGRKDLYLTAKRSKRDSAIVTIKQDGKERIVKIRPIHSGMFYANLYPFYGAGMLVDCFNENRFAYPPFVFIDIDDTIGRGYSTHLPWYNHKWELTITPPIVNLFITKFNYVGPSANPFGIVIGTNYYYSPKRYFSADAGICFGSTYRFRSRNRDSIEDFKYNSGIERKLDVYVSLMNYHSLGRFDIGYGLNLGQHSATRFYQRYKMDDTVLHDATYMSIGGAFGGKFRINNSCYFSFNYMPQFVAIDKHVDLNYEHAFNFGLMVKAGFGKKWKAK